jgi:hypothetical protein
MVNITASQWPVSGFAVTRGSIPRIRIGWLLALGKDPDFFLSGVGFR